MGKGSVDGDRQRWWGWEWAEIDGESRGKIDMRDMRK